MNLLNNITFNNPELFLLLILPLVHALWHFFSQKNTKNVLSFSNITLFSSKKIIKERLRHLPYLLQILSICLIITSSTFKLRKSDLFSINLVSKSSIAFFAVYDSYFQSTSTLKKTFNKKWRGSV